MEEKRCKYCGEILESADELEAGVCRYCQTRKNAISKISNRRSAFVNLKDFDVFSDENDFMEVTEWANGDGFDLEINNKFHREGQKLSFTWGEWEALYNLATKIGGEIPNYNKYDNEEEDK